jgi:hypothetical protein
MLTHLRIPVVLRPALIAVTFLSTSSPLIAQHADVARANDASVVPLTTRWPSREGIAVVATRQGTPMAIEVTSDGWVVLRVFTPPARRDDDIPASRLYAAPDDAERWTTAARRLLARLADTSQREWQGELQPLGRGHLRLAPHYWVDKKKGVSMQLVDCDGVWNTVDFPPGELEPLASALERATAIARRRAAAPNPPTLDRPYYRSEVSCVARRDGEDTPLSFPSTLPPSLRRYTEIGARFVVDTAGFVEAGAVALIPGAPAALARVVRAHVARWHFRPAEWSDLPVRQVVTAVLVFDPDEQGSRRDSARVAIARRERTADPAVLLFRRDPVTLVRRDGGWVHVRVGRWRPDGAFEGYQEWFHPDSVEAWIAGARNLVAADSAQPKHPPPPRDNPVVAIGPASGGNRFTVQYQTGWSSDTERLKLVTFMTGCANAMIIPTPLGRRLLDDLAATARSARRHRASLPFDERIYQRGEVACAAFIQPGSLGRADMSGVSRYPRAPYPDELSKENVRAEVLTSFVVDTMGTPIASTLEVAPGADPRAVASLRQSIEHVRFQPAWRAGQRVVQRVTRNWLLEAPSSCADERDGVDCARLYGRQP